MVLIFALHVKSEDECARRNAKLVATHLINDTCLNALKWPHKPTYMLTLAPDLHGSTRGCRTMTSNYPSAHPPGSTQTHRAPTPHAETKTVRLSDRQQQGHMEGCRTECGITVTQCTPHACISLRSLHTVHACAHTQVPGIITVTESSLKAEKSCRQWRNIMS